MRFAPVAQRIEHHYNELAVAGSSPVRRMYEATGNNYCGPVPQPVKADPLRGHT